MMGNHILLTLLQYANLMRYNTAIGKSISTNVRIINVWSSHKKRWKRNEKGIQIIPVSQVPWNNQPSTYRSMHLGRNHHLIGADWRFVIVNHIQNIQNT